MFNNQLIKDEIQRLNKKIDDLRNKSGLLNFLRFNYFSGKKARLDYVLRREENLNVKK